GLAATAQLRSSQKLQTPASSTCLAWRPRGSADFQICCIAGFQPADASPSPKPRQWRRLCRLEIGATSRLETCATFKGCQTDTQPVSYEQARCLSYSLSFGGVWVFSVLSGDR